MRGSRSIDCVFTQVYKDATLMAKAVHYLTMLPVELKVMAARTQVSKAV